MKQKKKKVLLKDKLLNEGWFETEKEAAAWAMLKRILVNDQLVASIHERVDEDSIIRIKEYYKRRYVNKGGLKLEKAIKEFGLTIDGQVALDCGASTGGFTDCLLQHGAKTVYAVDAGYGQLAGKLLIDGRVVNLEKTNMSDAQLLELDPKPSLITLDLSYLSLKKAIPVCLDILHNEGFLICLIKPIFEVDNSEIRRTGDINDIQLHTEILNNLFVFFIDEGLSVVGMTNSPVRGNNDTIEYLVGLDTGRERFSEIDYKDVISNIVDNAFKLDKFNKNDFKE